MLSALAYALTAMRARPILGWALRRTRGSLRQLVPLATRALPLLLLFITFLFINAEVWQLSASLDGSVLWLTVLLFAVIVVLFLLVRLPEEVDAVDDEIDVELIRRATRRTPLEEPVAALLEERGEELPLQEYGDVPGYERWNLILVLLVTQIAQVLLLSVAVLGFFLLFGGIVMAPDVQAAWTGDPAPARQPVAGAGAGLDLPGVVLRAVLHGRGDDRRDLQGAVLQRRAERARAGGRRPRRLPGVGRRGG